MKSISEAFDEWEGYNGERTKKWIVGGKCHNIDYPVLSLLCGDAPITHLKILGRSMVVIGME